MREFITQKRKVARNVKLPTMDIVASIMKQRK